VVAFAVFAVLTVACADEGDVSKKVGDGTDGGAGEGGSSAANGGSAAKGGAKATGGGPGSPSDPYGKPRTDGTVLLPGATGDRAVKKDVWFACVPHHGVFEAVASCCAAAGIGTEEAFELTAQGVGDSAGCAVTLQDSVDAGFATVDDAKVAACEAAFAADVAAVKTCSGERTVRFVQSLNKVCEDAIVGKQADGAPCLSDRDCVTGLACRGVAPGTPTKGVCQPPKALGEVCGPLEQNPDAAVAAPTVPNHPACAADAYCAGKCFPLLELGEDCEFAEACRSGVCRDVCVDAADVGGGQEGFQCDHDDDCDVGLYCKPSELADETFTCVPRLPTGTACTSDQGSVCVGGCISGACAPLCGLR
jgi:hypothetical protein